MILYVVYGQFPMADGITRAECESLAGVPKEYFDAAVDMCNRFIQLQALGGCISEGEEIHMKSLPPGLRRHHAGNLDDPDFNNVHVEIPWPR